MAPPAVEPDYKFTKAELVKEVESAIGKDDKPLKIYGDPSLTEIVPDSQIPSLVELKSKIPAHCFQPNLAISLTYVAQDVFLISGLYALAYLFNTDPRLRPYNALFLPVFWFFQGFMFWAVFVLGHDCGHGSFSRYPMINSIVGHILHSFILVPYHSWRLSHRKHHKNTGNFEKDEIFYPFTESSYKQQVAQIAEIVMDKLFFLGPLGYPYYLIRGYGNQHKHSSHISPNSDLFNEEDRPLVRNSCICWYTMIAILATTGYNFGLIFLTKYYIIPFLIYTTWLLVVTFLHHTEPGTKWYNTDNWNYVKGNLESIDRVYGWLEYFHHDIGTHVVHHLFPAIPHYRLREANAALKPYLGKLHKKSDVNVVSGLVESYSAWTQGHVIPDDTDIYVIPDPKKKQ